MKAKMHRLILKALMILIGGNEVSIAGDPWIDPVKLHGLVGKSYWDAIEQSRSTLPQFSNSFQNRTVAQSRFLACGLVEKNHRLVPVGVLVDRIEGSKFLGIRIENERRAIQGNEQAEIEAKFIIDWSFVDLWELQGGKLWKEVYRKLDKGHRVGAMQYIYSICQLSPPTDQNLIQRNLLRSLVESDFDLFQKLWKDAGSPKNIPMTVFDPYSHFSGHGQQQIQDIALQFSTLPFIKRFSKDIETLADDCLNAAIYSQRNDLFDYLLENGASADFRNDLLYTPLQYAAQCGNEYAVKRLLELKVGINTRDNGGQTALHKAVNAKVFSMLLEAGADHRIRTDSDINPQDPVQMQIAEGRLDILEECARRGLIEPKFLAEIREEASVYEKGSQLIQEYEKSIGSDTFAKSSAFRAGPVLPFDYLDLKSGEMKFGR